MRALLTVATLLAAVPAQEGGAQEKPPGPGQVAPVPLPAEPNQPPKPAPLDKTLAAVLAEIAATPHAFDGRLTWGPQRRVDVPVEPLECAFAGGVAADGDEELRWHTLSDWTVLQRGRRGATRHTKPATRGQPTDAADTGWQSPQGDAPEVPLSPRLLLEQLPNATLDLPQPTDLDGRPAMRVLATWHGKAAKAAALAAAVPSSRHEQLLDVVAAMIARDAGACSVCAEIRYDPATRRWLAATLRLLVVDTRGLPEDEPPLPTPEGLPAPTGQPQIELIVTLRRRDPEELPPPELDDRARELLRARDR